MPKNSLLHNGRQLCLSPGTSFDLLLGVALLTCSKVLHKKAVIIALVLGSYPDSLNPLGLAYHLPSLEATAGALCRMPGGEVRALWPGEAGKQMSIS